MRSKQSRCVFATSLQLNTLWFLKRFDDIRKAVSDLNKSYENLDKVKQKHEKSIKDIQVAKSALDALSKDQTASKKDIDKVSKQYRLLGLMLMLTILFSFESILRKRLLSRRVKCKSTP
jgi:predicted ribosome quality control (RQC) complex YloA/Tae2 family protein